MNVVYREKVQQPGDGHALLQRATEQLTEVLGPSAAVVNAEWQQTDDEKGRSWYRLTLSDFAGAVEGVFTANELESPKRLRSRLLTLVGDLLQTRSHKQIQEMLASRDPVGT